MSRYSNKVLFAEHLTSYFLNKHLWQNTPFGSKLVAPTTGRDRTLLYDAFTSNVKTIVDILHACLLNDIKQFFASIIISENANSSTFTAVAIALRNHYFTYGVDAGGFLHYSVILAILSGFFYVWGCKDVPEHAVEFISAVIPDYEMFRPFCTRLNMACRSFLKSEQTLAAKVLQASNFSRVPDAHNGGFKCSCFEYEETGKSFKIVFQNRKRALKKHFVFCVRDASFSFATSRLLGPSEFKESNIHSWNIKTKSGDVLKKIAALLKHGNGDIIPFRTSSDEEKYLQTEQKCFGFPDKPFLYRKKKNGKTPDLPSKADLSENNNHSFDLKQKLAFNGVKNVYAYRNELREQLETLLEEFASKFESIKEGDVAEEMVTYLKSSFDESSKSESDESQNKTVDGQIMSLRNEQHVIGPLNDKQVSYGKVFISLFGNLTNPLAATVFTKLVLDNTICIRRSFITELIGHLKLGIREASSRSCLKKPLPLPRISSESDESEDSESPSNELPDLIPQRKTIETPSPSFTAEISGGVKGDSPDF